MKNNKFPFISLVMFIISCLFFPFSIIRFLFISKKSLLGKIIGIIVSIFILIPLWFLIIKILLMPSGLIPSSLSVSGRSMLPTIKENETIKTIYYQGLSKIFIKIKRNDIVVFPFREKNGEVRMHIKRVIGINGDTISLLDKEIYLNGKKLHENYLMKPKSTIGGSFLSENKKIIVQKGYIFVLGDNRELSEDSRETGFISIDSITAVKKD